MRSSRWNVIAGIVAVLALGTVGHVTAQQRAAIADLEIALWPEYDRPSVLVIYRAELRPGSPFPATVRMRIPSAAGSPSAVAEQQSDGRLTNVGHRRTVDGDSAVIEMTVNQPRFQLEYYDPRIDRGEISRTFSFSWASDQIADSVRVVVQHPSGSRSLTTDPAAASSEVGGDGLLYSDVDLGAVGPGESVELTIAYEKDTDTLTAETVAPPTPAQAPVAAAPATRGGREPSPWVWVISTFGAVALGVGVWIVWNRNRSQRVAGGAGASGDKAAFCTHCGAPAGADDRFCHGCGKALAGS